MPTARERAQEGYEAGHDLGIYFGRLFWVIGTVNDAQRVGQWFAEHSGYTEMGPALGFVNGFSDGIMETQPTSLYQIESPKDRLPKKVEKEV